MLKLNESVTAECAYEDAEVMISFIVVLSNELPDMRDNRGKRHVLAFVVAAFVLATLKGRKTLSSIHRFICNQLEWLRTVTQVENARTISRAHLPRLLDRLDGAALDVIIQRFFGSCIEKNKDREWVAIDGKKLRGSQQGEDKQSVVLAIHHATRESVGQARQMGEKSSEIPVVRSLLKDTGLEKQKVSLDAHHCNPQTTAQIHQAGGIYLTQVKENQPRLLQQCQALVATGQTMAYVNENDKANGRVTARRAKLFPLTQETIAPRWKASRLATLLVVERETFHVSKQKTTVDTSYYISNQTMGLGDIEAAEELTQAVRSHWCVESENWIRDVTFNEDHIKVKAGNQAQIMARLRSLAITLIRKTKPKNFQATIEKFIDSTPALEFILKQVNFL